MEDKTYTTIDKSSWPNGEWMHEPDKMQYTEGVTGFPCLIVRGPSGALCGYVGVTKGHKYFNVDYNNVPVDVHGGLTYSNKCQSHDDEAHGVCHIVETGEDEDVWWLGFDCAHYLDICPKHNFPLSGDETYKNLAYVKTEITNLALQLL